MRDYFRCCDGRSKMRLFFSFCGQGDALFFNLSGLKTYFAGFPQGRMLESTLHFITALHMGGTTQSKPGYHATFLMVLCTGRILITQKICQVSIPSAYAIGNPPHENQRKIVASLQIFFVKSDRIKHCGQADIETHA